MNHAWPSVARSHQPGPAALVHLTLPLPLTWEGLCVCLFVNRTSRMRDAKVGRATTATPLTAVGEEVGEGEKREDR